MHVSCHQSADTRESALPNPGEIQATDDLVNFTQNVARERQKQNILAQLLNGRSASKAKAVLTQLTLKSLLGFYHIGC